MTTPFALRLFALLLVITAITTGLQIGNLEAGASSPANNGTNHEFQHVSAQDSTSCNMPIGACITNVGERLVEIDIGTDDGVKLGSTYYAIRGSSKIRLKVVAVSRHYSACTSSTSDHEIAGLLIKRIHDR